MLAIHETALRDAMNTLPSISTRVRTVASLPRLFGDALLKKYVADAPALYVVPGRITFADGNATLEFTVAGVVRNSAGHEKARNGDGIDLGCDHLMLMALVALDGKRLGNCTWTAISAEMADDELFEKAGISAIEVKFVGTALAIPTALDDAAFDELDDFMRLHADIDLQPQASASTHAQWLQEPPDYSGGQPDAQLDIQLPGASNP
ncbi:hypothetical protein [Rhodoferax sp.]|uniref:hypothetical protein n=1 Tax=Rhodoferax sp. TaxID=50421 RepID=UPI002ACD68E0|nr:hypothetical protein [Rhodoferax sp.]MDZ7920756.1 hypothetical protein [Rhodoferax sp.]